MTQPQILCPSSCIWRSMLSQSFNRVGSFGHRRDLTEGLIQDDMAMKQSRRSWFWSLYEVLQLLEASK